MERVMKRGREGGREKGGKRKKGKKFTGWENKFTSHGFHKVLVSIIYKELINQQQKMHSIKNRHSP
jgi:hypothetical protein